MNGFYKKRWFWILIILVAIIGIWILRSRRRVDGSKGGILEGASHANGGIKTKIKSTGETVEVQGGEDILTADVNNIKERYVCEGTPGGIASELNVIGGGVKFSEDGSCRITRIPIEKMPTRTN